MSDKLHDPTRWSHSTTELAKARTPPRPDSGTYPHMGSVRSSQYSGTQEDGNKTALDIEIGSDEHKAMVSSGRTTQVSREKLKQTDTAAVLANLSTPDDADTKPAQTSAADRATDLELVLSSGRQTRLARQATKSYDKPEGSMPDFDPPKDTQGEASGGGNEGSKRSTFGGPASS